MQHLARRLGLRTDPVIFFTSAGLMVLFVLALVLFPGPIGAAFAATFAPFFAFTAFFAAAK